MLRIKFSFTTILIAALALPALCCASPPGASPSVSGLALSSGLSSDYSPLDNRSEFYIDSPRICCSLRVTGVSENTSITVDWVYIRGQMSKEASPLILRDKASCSRDCITGFTLPSPAGGFISGDYRVDIFIAGLLVDSAAFSILREDSLPPPQIVTFTAVPSRISAGQPVQLSWKVSNASRTDIQPVPGPVDTEGTATVTPTQDTAYTLYAVNRGGVSSSRLNVTVSPAVKEKPDLQITEMWTSGNILAYRVKNAGNLASCPAVSQLYKNGDEVSQDYVAPLAAGEERVEAFQQYHFSPRFNYLYSTGTGLDTVTMRACIESDKSCTESDRFNNCFERVFGK